MGGSIAPPTLSAQNHNSGKVLKCFVPTANLGNLRLTKNLQKLLDLKFLDLLRWFSAVFRLFFVWQPNSNRI